MGVGCFQLPLGFELSRSAGNTSHMAKVIARSSGFRSLKLSYGVEFVQPVRTMFMVEGRIGL